MRTYWLVTFEHGPTTSSSEVLEGTIDEVVTQVRYDVNEIQLMIDDGALPAFTKITIEITES